MKRAILSFGFGQFEEFLNIVKPTFERYAEKHGYELIIPTESWFEMYSPRIDFSSRPYSWWKVPLIEWCFAHGYDEVLWLDADVAIVRSYVDLFSEIPEEFDCACVPHHNNEHPFTPCLGVWAVRNRPQIFELLQLMWEQTDLINHDWWEQSAFLRILGFGLTPPRLPNISNRFLDRTYLNLDYRWSPHRGDHRGMPLQPFFVHATMYPDRAETLRTAVTMSEFVGYDVEAYSYLDDSEHMGIDARHALWLNDVLVRTDVCKVLEIGSHRGYSASAIIEAMVTQNNLTFDICDIDIKSSVRDLADRFPERIRLLQKRGADALRDDGPWDIVWVDGDHRLVTVAEETYELLRLKPRIVVAHDTGWEQHDVDGPLYLKYRFQTHPDYWCVEDAKARPHESTGRGMFFATRDLKCLDIIKKSMKARCTHFRWPGSL